MKNFDRIKKKDPGAVQVSESHVEISHVNYP